MRDNKRLDAGESMTDDGSGDESGEGETRYYAEQLLAAPATPVIL